MKKSIDKDELIFCINCVKSGYDSYFTDGPEKIKQLIEDIFDIKVDLQDVIDLYDVNIVEEEEVRLLYKEFGYD
jgi:hypothetical protein